MAGTVMKQSEINCWHGNLKLTIISAVLLPLLWKNNNNNHHHHQLVVTVPTSQNNPMMGTSEAIHPRKSQMKREQHAKLAVSVVSGALVGTLVLGPVGTVLGAPLGCYTAKKLSKHGERQAQRKWEHASVQHAATQSSLVHGNGALA